MIGKTDVYNDIDWKIAVFNKIENDNNLNIPIPFTIDKIRAKGFIVNVYGLMCFVPFIYMPWQYIDVSYWEFAYKVFEKKVFYAKVLEMSAELSTYFLNAKIPQFTEAVLEKDVEYLGVILKKENSYMVVDIGYHFFWDCGSICGIIEKYDFNLIDFSGIYKVGDIITVRFKEKNGKGIFFKKEQLNKWFSKLTAKQNIGKKVIAKIVANNGIIKVKFLNNYIAILPINTDIYPEETIDYMNNLIYKMKIGDEINCRILKFDNLYSYFIAEWLFPYFEIYEEESTKKNLLIGKKVIVDKRTNFPEAIFYVFKKCSAIFPITEEFYHPSLLNIIENKLRSKSNGNEKLQGEILDIDKENKVFIMKWILPNIKAFRIYEDLN